MRQVRTDPTVPVERLVDVEIARRDGRSLLLDAVFPAGRLHGEPVGPRPAVLYVEGSGWSSGRRSSDAWLGPYLATHGFFAASADYRPSGEAPFPAQIQDVKTAIRWLRANAGSYGIDPDRIGIWGDSAGAHLAALAGVTGDSGDPDLEGGFAPWRVSSRVQAVVWAAGVSDFQRQRQGMRRDPDVLVGLFGGPLSERDALLRLASPLTHVRPTVAATKDAPFPPPPPPFLLLHGTRDETTPFEQAALLHGALRAAGGASELVPLLGRFHNGTGLAANSVERWRWWDMAPMALPFFVKHLRRH